MKRIFKWLFRLVLLAVVLLVIFFLSLDSILRLVVEHNIREQTGMDAEIGKFHLDLFSPVITIKDFKLYNPPDFGGTLFLDIPEIHAEYDRDALLKHEIRVTLMRFNLGELDIVKNEKGRTNIFSISTGLTAKNSKGKAAASFKEQTGYDFQGIDILNISIGTAKYIDLKDQRNNRTQKIDIESWPMRNVKSEDDLISLVVFEELRSNYFLSSLVGPKNSQVGNSAAVPAILHLFGVAF
jgi:hypothetical protein